MKILFYAHSSTLYGANRSLIDLMLGLQKVAPQISSHIVLPHQGPIEEELEKHKLDYSIIPHYNWFYYDEFTTKTGFLKWLWIKKNAFKKKLLNKKYFQHHQQFALEFKPNLVYVNSSLAPMGLLLADKLKLQVVWHHRETVDEDNYQFYLEDKVAFRRFHEQTDYHIFISEFLKNSYSRFKTFGKSHVVYNGINIASFREKRTIKSRELRPLRFGIVGRLNRQKNQAEVVKLFKEILKFCPVKNLELVLIGGGTHDTEAELKTLGHKKIHFKGFLKPSEIYRQFDVLITNAEGEAFGRTIAEANAYGIPVLAKNSGAFPELIEDGINGWIYESMPQLQEHIERLLMLTENELEELSDNAITYAGKKFKRDRMATEVNSILKKLIRDRNS